MLNIYIFSPEVLVPAQTDATFEIDEYFQVGFPLNKISLQCPATIVTQNVSSLATCTSASHHFAR